MLTKLIDEGFAANRYVHYSRNHSSPASVMSFRATALTAGTVVLRPHGAVTVHIDGLAVSSASAVSGLLVLEIPQPGATVEMHLAGSATAVPAVGIVDGAVLDDWSARIADTDQWVPADPRLGGHRPPHEMPVGMVRVLAQDRGDGIYDVGAPVLGYPRFNVKPRGVLSGESIEEACSDPKTHETRHEIVPSTDGGWTTSHRLGFRFLRLDAPERPTAIAVDVAVAAVRRVGAFVCDDDELSRIWATAYYTLRTCSQGLLVDGIKRDRMPWAGDQALSTLANAFTLADARLVHDGLSALGQPRCGYVNGISDYSLWWLINADLYLRYFGTGEPEHGFAQQVQRFVESLAEHVGDDAVFRPSILPGSFVDSGPGSVFIDWGETSEEGNDSVALQMLWYWALQSAENILDRVGDPAASRWSGLRHRLEATLRDRGWIAAEGSWAKYLDRSNATDPALYANFLALLAGIDPVAQKGVVAAAGRADAGTPFMSAMRLRALLREQAAVDASDADAGNADGREADRIIDEIRRIWGPMLREGPGTFWEDARINGDQLAMYGRPFGRSLCHAWSAGPAALLPETVLGITPLLDGWRKFSVTPRLGELSWAAAVVPAATGDIVVVADGDRVTVEVPAGTSLVRPDGRVHAGPAVAVWILRASTAASAPVSI